MPGSPRARSCRKHPAKLPPLPKAPALATLVAYRARVKGAPAAPPVKALRSLATTLLSRACHFSLRATFARPLAPARPCVLAQTSAFSNDPVLPPSLCPLQEHQRVGGATIGEGVRGGYGEGEGSHFQPIQTKSAAPAFLWASRANTLMISEPLAPTQVGGRGRAGMQHKAETHLSLAPCGLS